MVFKHHKQQLQQQQHQQEQSGVLGDLPPLPEEPTLGGDGGGGGVGAGIKAWVREQLERRSMAAAAAAAATTTTTASSNAAGRGSSRRAKARMLAAIAATALGPFPIAKIPPSISPLHSPIEASAAQYILQQYLAAVCSGKPLFNSYATGRFRMSVFELGPAAAAAYATAAAASSSLQMACCRDGSSHLGDETGCFVQWQMAPDKWYAEVSLGGGAARLRAGSDGRAAWRRICAGYPHAEKAEEAEEAESEPGAVRPPRRALQGLDPGAVAALFSTAVCAGEAAVDGVDCFVLKATGAAPLLTGPAAAGVLPGGLPAGEEEEEEEEVIRQVAQGMFCQRSGLLMRMEDAKLARVGAAFWDVRSVWEMGDYGEAGGGVCVAQSGRCVTSAFRFGGGDSSSDSNSNSSGGGSGSSDGDRQQGSSRRFREEMRGVRVEEWWRIDDAAFNVPGVCADCFLAPIDCRGGPGEFCRLRRAAAAAFRP